MGLRRRRFGSSSRLLAGLALVSCLSVCLLVHQLGGDVAGQPDHGHDMDTAGRQSSDRHWHRYLLMAAAGSSSQPVAASPSPPPEHSTNQTEAAAAVPVRQEPSRRLPRLLIIGVRKGGTRALLEMLNLHPNIAMVPVEVHYFDKMDNYQRGLEWYRSQMPLSNDNQLTVEKSPSYYVTPEVPERVWAMNPHVQLVLIVRDPVTRLLSDFAQIEASRAAQGLPNRRFQVGNPLHK